MQTLASSSVAPAATILRLIVALLAGFAGAGPVFAVEPQAPANPATVLEGKSYRGEMLDSDGRVLTDKEKLVFSNGKFVSEACREYGFGEGPYWIRVEKDKIHFLAETTSAANGTMLWKGTVAGGKIDARLVWTKERWYWTVRREFSVRGSEEK